MSDPTCSRCGVTYDGRAAAPHQCADLEELGVDELRDRVDRLEAAMRLVMQYGLLQRPTDPELAKAHDELIAEWQESEAGA